MSDDSARSSVPRVILKPRRARPFFARHPWVFDSSIERVDGQPAAGDEVDVVSHEGQFIARGLYNPASTIRARLYRWEPGPLDEDFWSGLIIAAARLRHQILGLGGDQSAYRLVSSEGDGLSGLTVDCYDRWLVAQFTSLALYHRRELILRLLMEAMNAVGAILRTERGIAQKEGLPPGEMTTIGSIPDGPVAIIENGLTYRVDLREGPEDRLLSGPAAQSPGRRELLPRQRRPGPLLFHRRFFVERLRGGASGTLGIDSSAAQSSWLDSTPRSIGLMALSSKTATCSRFSRACGGRKNASTWSSATRPSLPRAPATSRGHSKAT